MRVIVTGNRGYIGGAVVDAFRRHGHEVRGIDTGYFAECLLGRAADPATARLDIRDVTEMHVAQADSIVHLAALSNDPVGNLDPVLTHEINHAATLHLAQLAKSAGVRRFVFASSCIMYGVSDGGIADETAPLDPCTDYAKSKVDAETALRSLADDVFSPVYLRNGTVYGAAPRMRLDTVFNDFVSSAMETGCVVVRGDGSSWRPVVDVRDVAEAFVAAAAAPPEVVHNESINIGAAHLNQQMSDLAAVAASLVPGADVKTLAEPGSDVRTYHADFTKCQRIFPGLSFRSIEEGGADLVRDLSVLGWPCSANPRRSFVRLERLRELISGGHLDPTLRWAAKP